MQFGGFGGDVNTTYDKGIWLTESEIGDRAAGKSAGNSAPVSDASKCNQAAFGTEFGWRPSTETGDAQGGGFGIGEGDCNI